MIVCSCNVLTDRDVRNAVLTSEEPLTPGEVYGCLGCSRQCGRCARTIKKIMNDTLTDVCTSNCTLDHEHTHPHHAHPHHTHHHHHAHQHGHSHAAEQSPEREPAPAFTMAAAAA